MLTYFCTTCTPRRQISVVFLYSLLGRVGTRASVDPFPNQAQPPASGCWYLPRTSSTMPLSTAQITAANEVINILSTTPAGPRAKRKLGEMFMDLVDKDDLPEYYEV